MQLLDYIDEHAAAVLLLQEFVQLSLAVVEHIMSRQVNSNNCSIPLVSIVFACFRTGEVAGLRALGTSCAATCTLLHHR